MTVSHEPLSHLTLFLVRNSKATRKAIDAAGLPWLHKAMKSWPTLVLWEAMEAEHGTQGKERLARASSTRRGVAGSSLPAH